MISSGGRPQKARTRTARFERQLAAFGEVLAAHPFAGDHPEATADMAAEFARAREHLEAAERDAARDRALARRELDASVAALNRLNARIAGTFPEKAGTFPEKEEASEPKPQASAPEAPRSVSDRPRPRLRDRYTSKQLALRGGLAALALYLVAVAVLGGWSMAVVAVMGLIFGFPLAYAGADLGKEVLRQVWGAFKGGIVEAEYRRTAKAADGDAWEQHFVYEDADGRSVTYRRGVPKESLAALPSRKLWLVAHGDEPELQSLSTPLWLTLLLAFMLSVFLAGAVVVVGAVPGMLIAVLTGHTFG
ncbi:hypothetical protein [Actinomadura montaniterrae]|uniref:Uncharacterized protein n=1 Tax=Actinomadura montaniterrae TaxID=1803903 RepID=A0A6L3W6L0_9ACTN|nr:hypothetical protein [Actinomadura montaniterrae]KAB2389960.1 hypothetical protein F9B16_01575 [Actinomadura montaniterrae]